ncbi:hypothetical protein GCM10010103_26920 [Streptomyces paradoxus]|uniref:Mannose-6-phosphate isomerase-like protein (Cupin superfamily) n=1 Tax=Streptomyces paradoxus TaxID=66375 RepID=A0A7W9WHD5_9ACTN|nr:cupin domain-containing protein [Streptomyces paradoxus]MBB6076265.1 mannose-6-phosphate isomerase-like protein (cupin superfamily) [Streptomyces paradoxus]
MDAFETRSLWDAPEHRAPDGSIVKPLCELSASGGVAHFYLDPGEVSKAVQHSTVQEIWYVINGAGKMWRRQNDQECTEEITPGTCLTIPIGTTFQFRCESPEPLRIIGVTMPPWPADGEEEARIVNGKW